MTAMNSAGITADSPMAAAGDDVSNLPPESPRNLTTTILMPLSCGKSAPKSPVPKESGAFPSPALSKRDEIRLRLREKERKLTQLMAAKPAKVSVPESIKETGSFDASTIEGDTTPPSKIVRYVGKEEADRREAVRVLSQAALQMKDRLKKQKDEAVVLKRDLSSIGSSLKEKEDQKSLLEDELRRVRHENKTNERDLLEMKKALDEKAALLRQFQSDEVAEKEKELECQLSAAYEEVVWTQKDSMSKAEQIEYFEYQLLAKNHEIDDMKQELNTKLRRIVELEIDLEIHDDRFQTSMDEYSKAESASGTLSSAGDIVPIRKERIIDNTPSILEAKHRKGSFEGLRGIFRRKNKLKGHSMESAVSFDGTSNVAMDRVYKDLLNLEERYKKDKLQSRMQIEQLKQENNEYLIKVLSLEKSLQTLQAADDSSDQSPRVVAEQVQEQRISNSSLSNRKPDPSQAAGSLNGKASSHPEMLPNKTHFLEEKIETLENKNGVQALTIGKLLAKITSMEEGEKKRATQDEQVVHRLRLESETRELTIAALECELNELSQSQTLDHSFKALHVNAAAGLEAKLQENLSEVIRLRKEQEIKDMKIESLRAEIIELRLVRMQFEKAAQLGTDNSEMKLESIREDVGVANGVVMGTETPTQVDKIAPIPNEAANGIYSKSKYRPIA